MILLSLTILWDYENAGNLKNNQTYIHEIIGGWDKSVFLTRANVQFSSSNKRLNLQTDKTQHWFCLDYVEGIMNHLISQK